LNPRVFIFWSLLAVVTLAPLPFGSNRPWSWSLLSLSIGLFVLFWAIAAFRDRRLILIEWQRARLILVPFSLLVLWFLVQASGLTPEIWDHPFWKDASNALGMPLAGAISLNPEASHTALMRLLAYGGVFWLAFQFGRHEKHTKQIFWAIAIAGTLYALYGLAAHLSGSEKILWYQKWAYKNSLTSTFVNRNNYATYAGITLIATLTLLLAEIRHVLRYSPISSGDVLGFFDACGFRFYYLIATAGTIFTTLLLTHSRGGFLSAAIGLTAFAIVSNMRIRRRGKIFALLPIAIAGAFACGIVGAIFFVSGGQTLDRMNKGFGTTDDRLAIYEQTLTATQDAPATGIGIGAFKEGFRLYRDEDLRFYVGTVGFAHNTYLELALEAGIPALFLIGILFSYLTLLCLLGALHRVRNALYPAAGVAITALVGTHALVDFSLQIPAVAVTYLLLFGGACAQSWSTRAFPVEGD